MVRGSNRSGIRVDTDLMVDEGLEQHRTTARDARLRRHLRAAALGAFLLGGLVITLVIWVPAKQGSKAAELGSSLLSGVVVGIALLLAEQVFSRSADERRLEADANAANRMTANAEPVRDVQAPSSDAQAVRGPSQPSTTGTLHRYSVEYEGSMRDASRIDAQQLRLRVFRDGHYFQFITVPVPGPSLRGSLGLMRNTTLGQLWRAIAMAAGPRIEEAGRRGDIPLPDPTTAFEVYPDIEEAAKTAPKQTEVKEDEVVYTFELDR